jgi:hypothetical protein
MPAGVAFKIENLSESEANNLAIVSVTSSPTIVRPGDDATVRATLFNYGEFEFTDVGVELTLNSDGRQLQFEETVTVPSQEAIDVEFTVDRLRSGLWEGTVDLEVQDDLAFDNRRHLVISSRSQSRVVIVDGSTREPAPGTGIFFLVRAVGLALPGEEWDESPFRAEVVRYQEGDPIPALAGVDVVILADSPPVAADAARLRQFVETGGGMVVFSGEQTTAGACQPMELAELTPGTLDGIRRTSDLPFRIRSWDKERAILAPFGDPQHGDLRRFGFSAYMHITPSPTATVLARFGDEDSPALLSRRLGTGRILWVTSTAGPEWNSACRSRLYVPLIHQLLGECVGLTGAGPIQSWTVDSWRNRIGSTASVDRLRPGVISEDQRSHIVSVDESESDPESCAADELADTAAAEGTEESASLASGTAAAGTRAAMAMQADEWWPFLVLALTALLLVETLVANRTTA